jgi:hypothetical protein
MSIGHQDGNMIHLIDDMELFFEELNNLRQSGTMNMFGAPRWLQDNYDLSRDEAQHVFLRWTKTIEA